MMVLCRECEHWGDNPGAEFRPCNLPGTWFFVCADDYREGLYTAADFGCVAGRLRDKARLQGDDNRMLGIMSARLPRRSRR